MERPNDRISDRVVAAEHYRGDITSEKQVDCFFHGVPRIFFQGEVSCVEEGPVDSKVDSRFGPHVCSLREQRFPDEGRRFGSSWQIR